MDGAKAPIHRPAIRLDPLEPLVADDIKRPVGSDLSSDIFDPLAIWARFGDGPDEFRDTTDTDLKQLRSYAVLALTDLSGR